jgi:NNP family nitrate/nitrite transporter-like MFS transporter
MRAIVGPLCDRFGPRYVFAGILLCGAIPSGLAGTISSPAGLLVIRFFIGILGATFVPCQVWATGFYDKKVVGAANAISAGIGNAGGGITYFVIPAVFDSLVKHQHLTPHKAWRVTFVVPSILIIATALGMLFMCEDTPTGPWSDRHLHTHGGATKGVIVDSSAKVTDVPKVGPAFDSSQGSSMSGEKHKNPEAGEGPADVESIENILTSEIVVSPTWREAVSVIFSLQCFVVFVVYASSFGGELAINSILGAYYAANFKNLGQTRSGQWWASLRAMTFRFEKFDRSCL